MSGKNVILFGESGVGKSSVVNMLLAKPEAPTSSSANGCTFESVRYESDLDLGGIPGPVWVHDIAGLDESSAGTVSRENAVANLYDLLRKCEGGISLLAFVIRLGRITKRNQKNYRLFYEGICQNRVRIVLIVTHGEDACDDDDDDDDIGKAMVRWWEENKPCFQSSGMIFDDQAVIVATKRGFQKEYEESREKVREMIRSEIREPWKMEGLDWVRVSAKYYLSLLEGTVKSHLRTFLQTHPPTDG